MFQLGEERIATCSSCFNGMVFGVPSWLNKNKVPCSNESAEQHWADACGDGSFCASFLLR